MINMVQNLQKKGNDFEIEFEKLRKMNILGLANFKKTRRKKKGERERIESLLRD